MMKIFRKKKEIRVWIIRKNKR